MKPAAALTVFSGFASAGAGANALSSASKDLLCRLYEALTSIVGVIAVLVIVVAGVKWVYSQDDPGQRKLAKDAIKAVLVGIAVVLLADAVVQTLTGGSFTGCP